MYSEEQRSSMANRITLIGSVENLVLTALKLTAGIMGKSGAMIADGVHSLSDFVTDFIIILSFVFSKKPEDDNHNYGHGRIETVATTLISVILTYAGFLILKSGIMKIIFILQGNEVESPKWIALGAAVISVVIKEILYRQTIRIGKKIDSQALVANAWHHRSDAFSSLGAMIGIGGAIILGEEWVILDPLASVVVSIFIVKVGIEIFLSTMNELMEGSLSSEEIEKISNILENNSQVLNFHKLRTRKIGNNVAIEFHIVVNHKLSIVEAHDISVDIEDKIKTIFGKNAYISIHIEPSGYEM